MASSYHPSCLLQSRGRLLCLSLTFAALTTLRVRVGYVPACSSPWVGLMFPHDDTQAPHLCRGPEPAGSTMHMTLFHGAVGIRKGQETLSSVGCSKE